MPSEHRNAVRATAVTVDTEDGPADLQTVLDELSSGAGEVPVHTHTAAQISNASAVGRAVLTAADAAAARTAIGAGTSSLAIGTTASTAAAGNHTHTGLLTGSATAVNNSTATDVAGLVTDFNALLGALRARGIITGA